jgi:hypothetical protein
MRFCSRCGFQLAAVAELLVNDGVMQVQGPEARRRPRFSRFGAKLIFFSVVLFPVLLLLSISMDAPEILFIPGFLFLAGASQIAYKRLFGETSLPEGRKNNELNSPPDYQLPSMRDVPAGFGRRDTADFSAPPSVTERTTTLLKKDA